MAPAPTTSAFIPPPPLPEYYQRTPKVTVIARNKEKDRAATSTETDMQALLVKTKTTTKEKSSKQDITTTHAKSQIGIPIIGNATDARMMMPHMANYNVPPLAVHHICRICLRPRSNRYHREHPIPVNGVPPPPGICRRCRVKKVEEKEVVEEDVIEVVKVRDERLGCPNLFQGGQSNEVQVGINAFVPQHDIISGEEASRRRDREVLRKLGRSERLHGAREVHEESSESEEDRRRITYRHVHVRERSVSSTPHTVAADVDEAPIPKPRTSAMSTAQDAINAVSQLSQEPVMTTATAAAGSMEVQPSHAQPALTTNQVRSTKTKSVDNVEVSVTKADAGKTSLSTSYAPSKSESQMPVPILEVPRSGFTEKDIRRLAREEVVKFRHAERKLEVHPHAYAHGRLIPVERRIEKSRDVREPRPWEDVEVRVVEQSETEKRATPHAAQAQIVERDPQPDLLSQRSQHSKQDRSDEHINFRVQPDLGAETQSKPQPSRASRQDFAYQAYTHTGPRQSERQSQVAAELASQHGENSHSGWSSARGQLKPPRDVVGYSGRSSWTESKSSQKTEQTLQETKQSSRVVRSTTITAQSECSEAKKQPSTTKSWLGPSPFEGNSPVSVKPREVLSRDPTQGFEPSDPWQEPSSRYDVIDVIRVIEEPEQPSSNISRTASRLSKRLEELKEEPRRGGEISPSTQSESGHLDGGSAANTASRHSHNFGRNVDVSNRKRWELDDDKTIWPASSSSRIGSSQDDAKQACTQSQASRAASSQSDSLGSPDDGTGSDKLKQRAFDHRMATVKQQEAGRRARASNESESPTRPGAQQVKDSQPLRNDEYIWARRVVRPLDDDEERVPHDDLPAKHRSYVEKFFRQSFEPVRAGPTKKSGRPADHWIEVEDRLESGKPTQEPSSSKQECTPAVRTEVEDVRMPNIIPRKASPPELQPTRAQPQRRHYCRETKGSPSSTSTRVRFASKVDVSPTPPGSDASSSQFRIIGGRGGSKKRVEGESGEDLIAEYENRGRTRARRDRRHHEPIEEGGSEYYHEKKHSVPEKAIRGMDAVNRWDGADDAQYRPRKNKPLQRALSESPSRERLSEALGGSARIIEPAGAVKHQGPWHATVESLEREGSGVW